MSKLGVAASLTCSAVAMAVAADPLSSVDPFIGTGGHGHCFPGATMPHGLVQLSPDTRDTGWDACGGYHYDDATILGFSHTHISGTGVEEMGDVLLMPMVGTPTVDPGTKQEPESGYRSRFSHKREKASPGYYAVTLDDYDTRVELTATPHVGFHRISFPETDEAHVVLDLSHGLDRRRRYGISELLLDARISVQGDRRVVGYRMSTGWVDLQEVFFVIEFSRPFTAFALYDTVLGRPVEGIRETRGAYSATKPDSRGWFRFDSDGDTPLVVRVGLSTTSIEGAERNLRAQGDHWDFDRTRSEAEAAWRDRLGRIEVEGSERDRRVFYTALYHAHIAPNQIADVDGAYLGPDHRPGRAPGGYYSTLSLWDTFRATHPLYTLIAPDIADGAVRTMLVHHERQGYLPLWTAWGKELHTMIGNHSVPVIVEAIEKGVTSADPRVAYAAVRKSLTEDHYGSPFTVIDEIGYVPREVAPWSVSRTLEMAYDDACAAVLARRIGADADADFFEERSSTYRNLIDRTTATARGRDRTGAWVEPYDPDEIKNSTDYKEGSARQYSWFVPHDVAGLIELHGGRDRFEQRLTAFFGFDGSTRVGKGSSKVHDVTGFLGDYAHGNEVGHHTPYLFNRAGRPDLTRRAVAEIRKRFYHDAPDGYAGNEDCGAMSAWHILSAIGFFPIDPVSGEYDLGLPAFDRAVVLLHNGRRLEVLAPGASKGKRAVREITFNGAPVTETVISHANIMGGGVLEYHLTNYSVF